MCRALQSYVYKRPVSIPCLQVAGKITVAENVVRQLSHDIKLGLGDITPNTLSDNTRGRLVEVVAAEPNSRQAIS